MGAETEVPRVRDFLVQHHCGRTLGLVDRRGGSCEGASWEASQRRPQEDAEGMLIRHTEHCTCFKGCDTIDIFFYLTRASVCLLL